MKEQLHSLDLCNFPLECILSDSTEGAGLPRDKSINVDLINITTSHLLGSVGPASSLSSTSQRR